MKRALAVFALVALVASGAFAQLAIGGTASMYTSADVTLDDAVSGFANGEGLFYGPFVELGMGKLALGLAGNFSFYEEDYSYYQDGSYMVEMMDYDISIYLQLHLFKYKSFIDPFVEGGIGMMAKDYRNEADDPDIENPLMGTYYYQFGGGLGVNLGSIGIFVKALYMIPYETVTGTYYDEYGYEQSYDLGEYPLQELKIYAGAKLIL